MNEFVYLQKQSEIYPMEKGWIAKEVVASDSSVVDYGGHSYKIQSEHVLPFTVAERVARAFEGMLRFLLFVVTFGRKQEWSGVEQLFTQETKESKLFAIATDKCISSDGSGDVVATTSSSERSDSSGDVVPITSSPERSESPSFEEASSRFDSQTERMSFWSAYLEGFIKAAGDGCYQSLEGKLLLNDEYAYIRLALCQLKAEVDDSDSDWCTAEERAGECGEDSSSGDTFGDLSEQLRKLIEDVDSKAASLHAEIVSLTVDKAPSKRETERGRGITREIPVQGLRNVGNTCYINSALQPLLAVGNFPDLVPKIVDPEPADTRVERQKILDALHDFLASWKKKEKCATLGEKVGALRREIFKAGLVEGGFLDRSEERGMHDAGQFFELILHVIGRGFSMRLTKEAYFEEKIIRTRLEDTSEACFLLKRGGRSVQQKVNAYREKEMGVHSPDDLWRVEDPVTGEEIGVSDYLEEQKILGEPPPFLVLRVDHAVDPNEDFTVDFTPLFKEPSGSCKYQLAGFSQNHHQVHWTSVVFNGKKWKYCNDETLASVESSDRRLRKEANYLVYKRL